MNPESNNIQIKVFNELWEVVHKHQPQLNPSDSLFVGERILEIQKKLNKLQQNY